MDYGVVVTAIEEKKKPNRNAGLIHPMDFRWLRSFYYPSLAEARRANALALGSAIGCNTDGAEIREPSSFCPVVRMADIMTCNRS